MTKCLLVRGYKKDAGWGFPRGKLSKDETDAQCAEREVWVGGGWGGRGTALPAALCMACCLLPASQGMHASHAAAALWRRAYPWVSACTPSEPAHPPAHLLQVLEETGLDISAVLRESDFIDAQLGDQDTRLFIVQVRAAAHWPGGCGLAKGPREQLPPCSCCVGCWVSNRFCSRAAPCAHPPSHPCCCCCRWCAAALQGVDEGTHFAPHVRYEIGAFGWYLVDHLPATYEESKQVGGFFCGRTLQQHCKAPLHCDGPSSPPLCCAMCLSLLLLLLLPPPLQAFVNDQGGRHKFFNVWPYMRPLRAWIKCAPPPTPLAAAAAAAGNELAVVSASAPCPPAPPPSSTVLCSQLLVTLCLCVFACRKRRQQLQRGAGGQGGKKQVAAAAVAVPVAAAAAVAVPVAAAAAVVPGPAAAQQLPAAAAAAAAARQPIPAAGALVGKAFLEFRFDRGPILQQLQQQPAVG